MVAALVPLRTMIVSRLFSERDLVYLDPSAESEEEYLQQEHEIHEAHHRSRQDSSEFFHGFSEFRTKGEIHDALEHYRRHPEALER